MVLSNESMRTDDFVARVFPERHRKAMMQLIPDRMVRPKAWIVFEHYGRCRFALLEGT